MVYYSPKLSKPSTRVGAILCTRDIRRVEETKPAQPANKAVEHHEVEFWYQYHNAVCFIRHIDERMCIALFFFSTSDGDDFTKLVKCLKSSTSQISSHRQQHTNNLVFH